MNIREVEVPELPLFSDESTVPTIGKEDYEFRLRRLYDLMDRKHLTHVVVYGDREHFSNLEYLTGYDPRFEEALLILAKDEIPVLVVGNEGLAYSDVIPFEIKKRLFQSFSLVGQPRGESDNLNDILKSTGIDGNSRVGLIGWKYFTEEEVQSPERYIEIPHYIVQHVIELAGTKNVLNATDIMLHPDYGLRIMQDVKELVLHEIAGTKASSKVLNVIGNLEVGMSEMEASKHFCLDGEPLSVHPNVNFGERNVLLGLASPGHQILEKGQVINVALGYRRALTARAGLFVSNGSEIPSEMSGLVENLYIPYYRTLVAWYESIQLGVSGAEVFREVRDAFGDLKAFGVSLNPGHLIHTDEWTNSIFSESSPYRIRSGMAIQCDIIAFPGRPYVGVHVEDGIVIADSKLRATIERDYPESWNRISMRRAFMKDVLGINLPEEVLPTSNIQAVLFPYMGSTRFVMARVS